MTSKVTVIPIAIGARLPALLAIAVLSTTITRKKPSTASITNPGLGRDREGRCAKSDALRELGPPEPGGDAAQHRPQKERGGDAGHELADDVGDRFAQRHRPSGQHAHGDRRIEVGPGQIAVGEGEDHDGQAVGKSDGGDAAEAGAGPDRCGGAGTDEHECEGADELRKEPSGKMVLHFGLRTKTFSHLALSAPLTLGSARLPTS